MDEKVLLIVKDASAMVDRSGRNLDKLRINTADAVQIFDLLNADTVVMEKAAMEHLQATYGAASEQ
jgi:large subunit ribosomal protein L4